MNQTASLLCPPPPPTLSAPECCAFLVHAYDGVLLCCRPAPVLYAKVNKFKYRSDEAKHLCTHA